MTRTPWRLTTATDPFGDRPLDEALAAMAAAGIHDVELMGEVPHFSLDHRGWDPVECLRLARKRGVTIAHLRTAVGCGLVSTDAAEQQREWGRICRAIDLAAQIGARSIRLFREGSPADDPDNIPRLAPWLQCCARAGELKSVSVAFENGSGGISADPEQCLRLLEEVGSPFFGLSYNPSLFSRRGTGYRRALALLKEHVIHVRLEVGPEQKNAIDSIRPGNDRRVEWGGRPGSARIGGQAVPGSEGRVPGAPVSPGEGEIDLPWIFDQLRSVDYRGDISLVVSGRGEPAEAALRDWYGSVESLL